MQIETEPIAIFQEKTVPPGCKLAGWAALVRALNIPAPVRRPSCVSEQHVRAGTETIILKDGETYAYENEEVIKAVTNQPRNDMENR